MSETTNTTTSSGGGERRPAGLLRKLILPILVAVVLAYGLWIAVKWTTMRVYVPHDKALIVINKFGDPLPQGRIVVPRGKEGEHKGVWEEVLGPGRYFFNPVTHDTELVDLMEVPAGNPDQWQWDADGNLKDPKTAPQIGLVTVFEGSDPGLGHEIVGPGEKGLQREVLTPGTYRYNPKQKKIDLWPAVIVPPGSVGVVTRLIGDAAGDVVSQPIAAAPPPSPEAIAATAATSPSTLPAKPAPPPVQPSRLVVGANQRGTLKDVLQPGVYYLNPRMVKVTIMPVGYDEITLEAPQSAVRFLTSDGYQVEADLTVVWGRTPSDAPNIVANIGTTDDVRKKVVEQAVRSACQNEGARFSAQQLIEGETREAFQRSLSESLESQVKPRNIHILLALIRNIQIKDAKGTDQSQGLLATIQRANIEIERELTNKQKTQTATKQAEYEEALKLVELAHEQVRSDTDLKVATTLADGQKKAAEIDAEREVAVAAIELEVATLEARRTQIMGKANADVERLKNEAEAKGAKMLIDAFGSPQAYNQYVFAKGFAPQDLRMIFAGPGTFWTDLKSFEQVGASQLMRQTQGEATPGAPSGNRRAPAAPAPR